ncbi:MAG TPA: YciI family protein [Candidatus Didemnitutus sp.]|nr:YciI family protein [Candidatus Didemnitutus sp.]
MKYFYAKLHAPRPDFARTLTPAEMGLMREHALYLREFATKRWAVAFGPVADPQGAFGVGIWEVPDDVDVAALCASDPTIKSGLGFRYEIHPMPNLVTRG